MLTRKNFIQGVAVFGVGLLAAPLKAATPSALLTKREAKDLDALLCTIAENQQDDAVDVSATFKPNKVLKRVETAKGYKTTFRTGNGVVVELENFGTPISRIFPKA